MCEYGAAPKTVPVAAEECWCLNSHLLFADTLFLNVIVLSQSFAFVQPPCHEGGW